MPRWNWLFTSVRLFSGLSSIIMEVTMTVKVPAVRVALTLSMVAT